MRNKIIVTAGALVAFAGMASGLALANMEGVHTVQAYAFQKIADDVTLIDINGEKWLFEGLPFNFQSRYEITYRDPDFQLLRLKIDGETVFPD